MTVRKLALISVLAATVGACTAFDTQPDVDIVISIISTNDVHGDFMPKQGRGGLVMVAGYTNALRKAHAATDDAVLLLDAGDMWQGTLESNLNEGEAMTRAYEAAGYAAAAIGNHEFDYGQDALKSRAARAGFPFLAANLVVDESGELVDWDNVSPSVMLDVQGIRVGVIGVMTIDALHTTKAEHTRGLRVTPLAATIEREARALRDDGANLVVVASHAGSRCGKFGDPEDLSSCEMDGEIMVVANALPEGLVDLIIAGHVHERIAHVVNGIAITAAASNTQAFGRVDFTMDRTTGAVLGRRIFPPQLPCPMWFGETGECDWEGVVGPDFELAMYEGRVVAPDEDVLEIAEAALAAAAERKQESVGVYLEEALTLEGNPESALGNLFTTALLESVGGDAAIHNVSGGIRAVLPRGDLSFGAVYEMFPFDNRLVALDISGHEFKRMLSVQARKQRRRAGIAGVRVFVKCNDDDMHVDVRRSDGSWIGDEERVKLITNDFLATGGDSILSPIMPPGGFSVASDLPGVREALVLWLGQQGPSLHPSSLASDSAPRWNLPGDLPVSCRYPD
ncbi:MAG: bifunctional UDP-sugar hydrolase/5'-nucleotidase [Woeseiaceae bacterium]|nr:bifunctional UDP-sugar hydrolase/5'-nucleotidase [Woeseiaceae bacterium]